MQFIAKEVQRLCFLVWSLVCVVSHLSVFNFAFLVTCFTMRQKSLLLFSLDTWTFQLLTSTCTPPPTWTGTSRDLLVSFAHTFPFISTHTLTNSEKHTVIHTHIFLPSGHVTLASFSCWLTRPVKYTHMYTKWLYLSPLLNSITFTSFCSACPSPLFFLCRQLNGLLWESVKCVCVKGFRPAAWRHFAHPLLSSSKPSVL